MSKQAFIDAYNSRKARIEQETVERHKEQTERTRQKFLDRFRFEPDRVDFTTVWFEDVEMVLADHDNSWFVMGNCLECGERVRSRKFWGIDDIGEMIVDFKPDLSIHYYCPPLTEETKDNSWQARLTQAILDAISENIPQ